jgi:hypothetical protein
MLEDILVKKKIIMRPKEKHNWLGVAAGRLWFAFKVYYIISLYWAQT